MVWEGVAPVGDVIKGSPSGGGRNCDPYRLFFTSKFDEDNDGLCDIIILSFSLNRAFLFGIEGAAATPVIICQQRDAGPPPLAHNRKRRPPAICTVDTVL